MRATIAVMALVVVSFSASPSPAQTCDCVFPWPNECNKVCFQASGTVQSSEGGKVVLKSDDKTQETFQISNDAKGKDHLKEGDRVKVSGHVDGAERVIKDVAPMEAVGQGGDNKEVKKKKEEAEKKTTKGLKAEKP